MSSQDKLEQVLRAIHVMIAESKHVDPAGEEIILHKRTLLEHLNKLSVSMYEVMDEYEMTEQAKARAEREMRRKSNDIVRSADLQAEDVYAASILYTNDALGRIQNIMQDAMDSFQKACRNAVDRMEAEKNLVRSNQSELQGQLTDLHETDKYLEIIEDTNRRLAREKAAQDGEPEEKSPYANIKPEIRINPEYFERIGVPLDTIDVGGVPGNSALVQYATAVDEFMYEIPQEKTAKQENKHQAPEIRVNKEAAYFKQKQKNGGLGNNGKKRKKA